jgi:hypothetical protein
MIQKNHLNGRFSMRIDVGSYVRILPEYMGDGKGQTGHIEALPTKDHPDDYLVKLDGGPSKSPHFAGRIIRISAAYLELTNPTWRV